MTTTIHSNGSKWAGQEPDGIEDLIVALETYALDRSFEAYGNFIEVEPVNEAGVCLVPNGVNFFGNFLELSHVFNIDTDDSALIDRLTSAIRANQTRPDYLSQPTVSERRAANEAARRERDAKRDAERIRDARRTLGIE